eukprot:EG_transcript_27975
MHAWMNTTAAASAAGVGARTPPRPGARGGARSSQLVQQPVQRGLPLPPPAAPFARLWRVEERHPPAPQRLQLLRRGAGRLHVAHCGDAHTPRGKFTIWKWHTEPPNPNRRKTVTRQGSTYKPGIHGAVM